MSDSFSSGPWWQDRINEIKSQGFNTQKMENELGKNASQASAILEKYEENLVLANSLKKEINKLPNRLEIERIELLNKLEFIENANDVNEKLNALIITHLPWVSAAKNNRILWNSAGRGEYLETIVKRLDALDSSMNSYVSEILFLFNTPERVEELNKKIDEIENRQSERIAALDSMASLLSEHGFDIPGFTDMSLKERLSALEELQKLDEKHMQLERRIKRTIGRFDSGAAADYNQQRLLLTKTRSEIEFDALIERVKNTENDFLTRLQNINNQFSKWIQEGFNLNIQIPILADELLQRESEIENISQNIEEYKQIWNRLENQLIIWPEEDAVTLIEYGNIFEKNDIENIVIELERRSKMIEEEVRAEITKWKNKGFTLNEIEEINNENPVLAQNKIQSVSAIFEKIVEAKHLLDNLDLSFNEQKKREYWNKRIIENTPDEKTIDELLKWISIINKRNSRHRKMLENEWTYLKKDSEINTADLTLLEFENLIKKKENTSLRYRNDSVFNLKDRLMIEINLWLDDLKNKGWNVEELELMKNNDPNKLMLLKNDIVKNINNFEKLIQRLENLPWERNESLAKTILNDLKKPNMLIEIKNLIPQYMQILANSPKSENGENFKFSPWNPQQKPKPLLEINEVNDAEIIIDDSINKTTNSSLETNKIKEQNFVEKEKPEIVMPEKVHTKLEEFSGTPTMKENKAEKYQPTIEEWEEYTNSLNGILIELGISKDFDLNQAKNLESLGGLRKILAKQVGIKPRDLRVDRLLRLLLRLIPINLPGDLKLNDLSLIINDLTRCAKKLNKWTSKRLERRHNNASKKLLNDSKQLGEVLKRIPSPSFAIPLNNDNYDLPSINNLDQLRSSVNNLEKYIL